MKIDITIKIHGATPADVERIQQALDALKDSDNADKNLTSN